MAKFDLKGMAKNAAKNLPDEAMALGLTTAGIIGSQKFLDFATLFPKAKPDDWFMKFEGEIKMAVPLLTISAWDKMPKWMKYLAMGIAIQGAIKAARKYTSSSGLIPQIGRQATDAEMEAAAKEMVDATNVMSANAKTSVAGPNVSELSQADSDTGVAGMGLRNTWNDGPMQLVA